MGAVTPGRLSVHEDALVGAQVRAASVYGSFSDDAKYLGSAGTQLDLEQDVFGAVRIARRAQVALLVPVVQTYARTRTLSDFGGGFGDVNLSGRYDFVNAGEASLVPGIAALAGVTFPTGRPVDASAAPAHPLAADVTGVGAFQANLGVALEQTTGPWLFGVTGLYAKRASRTVQGMTTSLGAEWTILAATAYTFPNDAAVALLASYAIQVDSGTARGRRIPLFTLSALYPMTDQWRLQGGVFLTPPISDLGRNTLTEFGLVLAFVRSWS